jgi:hypothetical protein
MSALHLRAENSSPRDEFYLRRSINAFAQKINRRVFPYAAFLAR